MFNIHTLFPQLSAWNMIGKVPAQDTNPVVDTYIESDGHDVPDVTIDLTDDSFLF
ncbi:MAG: hypothetical protein AB8B85_14650 [Paracoccaceae bacterium]